MTAFAHPHLARAAHNLVAGQFGTRSGESVLVTADPAADRAVLDALVDEIARCGAKPLVALAPPLPFQGGLSDPYVGDSLAAAASASDVWLDLCFPYHAGSRIHADAMQAGRCRYGLICLPRADSLERLYGAVDFPALMDFNIAVAEFVAGATGETVRFTCEAGTDVRFVLDELKLKRARVCDKPGMDTIPGAQSLYPVKDSVRGRIVIQALFDESYRRLRKPITIHADGRITGFSGAAPEDHASFERALRRANGQNGLGTFVHFTYGFHPTARLTGQQFVEDIRLPGSNAIGMGLPWWEKGGGENHPDGVVLDQSLWIGDVQLLDKGNFVGPPELAVLHAKLAPRFD